MEWTKIGAALLLFIFVIWIYVGARKNPQIFAKGNVTKSLGTMGIVALLLILFVALLVFLSR